MSQLRVVSYGGGDEIARFWEKVARGNKSECWLWQGKPNHKGYGRFCTNHKIILAHRFAWIITIGEIPDGLYICHTCDTPACVNPSHMFLGTIADNNHDMWTKGRGKITHQVSRTTFQKGVTFGENHPRAKLSWAKLEEAKELREQGWTVTRLARKYGVSKVTMSKALLGKTWRMPEAC